MSTDTTCITCGKKHTGHICMLKSKGLTEEIAHVTNQPTVYCFICGSEANSADHVCEPVPIEKKDK